MNKLILFTILFLWTEYSIAQNIQSQLPIIEPYGKIDKSEFELTSCDFEKDANAEVLFDKANIHPDGNINIMDRHTRIKIFNEAGKREANIRLEYLTYLDFSSINHLEAETINIENGVTTITKLDKKDIFKELIDKYYSVVVFTMPNVKPGSIIEFKYSEALLSGYFPTWYFQRNLPVKYSELRLDLQPGAEFRVQTHVRQPFIKSIGKLDDYIQTRALLNVHSLPKESFIGSIDDNLQRIDLFIPTKNVDSWSKIGKIAANADDFGGQLQRGLNGEEEIIKYAKGLNSDYLRVAFIFDTVKNRMTWNEQSTYYTTDGTVTAWNKMVGNSAEINLILCRLLNKAGIKAFPLLTGDKNRRKLNPANPTIGAFSNTLVYVPVDSTQSFFLDATNKFNQFNLVPIKSLNTAGIVIDGKDNIYQPLYIEMVRPSLKTIYINAEIKPEGKLNGSAEINNFGYCKMKILDKHRNDTKDQYVKYLSNNDINTKISSVELTGANIDTLPLTQKFNFSNELNVPSENYIYFNTNIFAFFDENPFKSETRYSNIDLGYKENLAANILIKTPSGFKIDSLPPNITLITPDETMVFKRVVVLDGDMIFIKYNLNHKKSTYFIDDYGDIKTFYKKMYELLSEPILVKKQ